MPIITEKNYAKRDLNSQPRAWKEELLPPRTLCSSNIIAVLQLGPTTTHTLKLKEKSKICRTKFLIIWSIVHMEGLKPFPWLQRIIVQPHYTLHVRANTATCYYILHAIHM